VCRVVTQYRFDSSSPALLPDKIDPEIGKEAQSLLESKGASLHAERNKEVQYIQDEDLYKLWLQGSPRNFTYKAMQDMIVNFFYGKLNSIGVVFSKQKHLREVPDAMMALAAAVVLVTLLTLWPANLTWPQLQNCIKEYETGAYKNVPFSHAPVKTSTVDTKGSLAFYNTILQSLMKMKPLAREKLTAVTSKWIKNGWQVFN
jgi:hypothetical protein